MSNSTYARIPTALLIGTAAVVFLANAGLLMLQLVGGRLLAPFIGSSIETWTCVIGVFLTGIALGNWLGGRIADRFPSPKTVAVVLILSGLSSLGMIACSDWALSTGFYKSIPLGPRIPLLAFLFCLLPALLLSLLTPVTIKLLLPDVGSAGRVAGLIFALSTLGCLIGNYFTGFWLIAEFNLNTIIAGVGIGLLALAVPIFFLKKIGPPATPLQAGVKPDADAGPPDGSWDFRRNIRLAYAIVFLASFCGMSLELTGSRVLAPFLGVSLFTWTGIIGVMLAGTCCGNYLGGILADRGVGPALRRFAFIPAALAGAAAGPLVARLFFKIDAESESGMEFVCRILGAAAGILGVLLGLWISRLRYGGILLVALVGGVFGAALAHTAGRAIDSLIPLPWFTAFHESLSVKGFNAGEWLIHGLGFLAGAAIALLFLWDAPKRNERVTRSGALCGSLFVAGLMTLAILLFLAMFSHYSFMIDEGDIVQKVLAWTFGLFFLPMLFLGTISPQVIRLSIPDVRSAGRVAGNIYAWSTVGAIAGTFVTGYFLIASVGTFRVLMMLAFLLTLLAFFVGQLWKNNAMLYAASIVCGGAIFGLYIVDYGANNYDKETKYYAIKVTLKPDSLFEGRRVVQLDLDHLAHSFVNLDDPTWLHYEHEYIQGELLLLARSRHEHEQVKLLVIGGGGYTFPRYAEVLWPDVDCEVVEIDPGVTQIAHDKLTLPHDTKIRTFNMDGRQFISERAPKGHYHLIMQDAVNDYSVPAHLMTREYNEAIKAALTPDGAYVLTFIDSLQRGGFWRAAARTMRATFAHVYLLSPRPFEFAIEQDGQIAMKTLIRDDRDVYVIYGSNQPLDSAALDRIVEKFIKSQLDKRLSMAAAAPQAAAAAMAIAPWMLKGYTHVLDNAVLDHLLSDPKHGNFILTDQYCPVDNLMSDVFRDSVKNPKK